MKQNALHQFSAACTRHYLAPLNRCLILIAGIRTLWLILRLTAAVLLIRYLPNSWQWVGCLLYAAGILLLGLFTDWLLCRIRCTLLCRCTERLPLPCAAKSTVRKRLYCIRLLERGLEMSLHLLLIGGLFASNHLLYMASAHPEQCLYYLMAAMQLVPLCLLLVGLRIRWYIILSAADALSTLEQMPTTWTALKTARHMMEGQYGFLLRILLRSLPWLLLPLMLPRRLMTLHLYFSVRCLEWQYAQERSVSLYDCTDVSCRNHRAASAGGIPSP